MEQRLREILAIVTDHQKFAEAKNGALLAFDGALVIAVLQLLSGSGQMDRRLFAYLLCIITFAAVSGLVALLSFVPQTRVPQVRTIGVPENRDSLIFFGDVQKYSVDAYLAALRMATNDTATGDPSRVERMYAEQVIVNAKIASRKFTYFKYAVWIVVAGLTTPILVLLVYPAVRDHHSE
jgi:Family of unknown function (DUF5706)